MIFSSLNFKSSKGQVMFLTVIVLGVVISSVTVIAGLLMSYQIRRSADVSHSTRAIFAADAGVECMLFQIFKDGATGIDAKTLCEEEEFENEAEFFIELSGIEAFPDSGVPTYFISIGKYRNVLRSVKIDLSL